ncbi:hypothetical protein, partial [Dickeya chrysanthemi]|uniref:hypothetical protein n=1 Tax=Dickeya chrysanthemi TaxID=556 RepID=UPI001E4FD9D4
VRWLRSFTRITYLSKLIGILSLAAFLQLELFGVYTQRETSLCPMPTAAITRFHPSSPLLLNPAVAVAGMVFCGRACLFVMARYRQRLTLPIIRHGVRRTPSA